MKPERREVKMNLSEEHWIKLRDKASSKKTIPAKIVEKLLDNYCFDDKIQPIVFELPKEILGDKEQVSKWLRSRIKTVVEMLHKE